jgi:hypothetical protein
VLKKAPAFLGEGGGGLTGAAFLASGALVFAMCIQNPLDHRPVPAFDENQFRRGREFLISQPLQIILTNLRNTLTDLRITLTTCASP